MTDRQQVIDALCRPFPQHAIKQKGGKDYVSGTSVVYRLNTATNYAWDFEITGHELVGGEEAQGKKPAQVVYGRMRIPIISDGWRSDMGTALLENQPDDHEAYKGAATDCLKRCARLFGVGLHLWGPDIEAGEIGNRQPQRVVQQRGNVRQEYHEGDAGLMVPGAVQSARTVNQIAGGGTIAPGVGMTDNQRKAIWAIATKERGMTDADVEAMSMSMFGVELKALDKQQASSLIETLKGETDTAAPHPKVQQAIDTREANWITAMEGAATVGEIHRIGKEIGASGVSSEGLRAAYRRHLDRLQEQQLVAS